MHVQDGTEANKVSKIHSANADHDRTRSHLPSFLQVDVFMRRSNHQSSPGLLQKE